MKIMMIDIDKIIPYENNPRINDQAVSFVAASIKEFGFKVPIIIDKNNIIVSGHTRLKASKELGIKKVPIIIASDLTDKQIKAFRIADNKVAEFSAWDFDKLFDEVENLKLDFKMEDFGFTDPDNIDIDGFFEETEAKEKEDKRCPHCGEII